MSRKREKTNAGGVAKSGLDVLFAPASVAIVGASSDPARIGGRPISYYLRANFKGKIYPVNPKRDTVQGLKSYPDLASIPGTVDFAILSIPSSAIKQAMRDCGEKGVRAVLIFSAGFSEMGDEGAALQDEIAEIARGYGIRVLGPNCLGLYNAAVGHCPTFSSGLDGTAPKIGKIGLITQSGAYGTHLLSLAKTRRLGIGMWISTGNEIDVTTAECLEYLVESDDIDVIGLYMEGIRDPETMIRALERARELRKPVIIMKVGVSEVGSAAAQSHTASLAGSDASIQAVFDQVGAMRARTTEDMLDVLYAASISAPARGDRLGILTVSGGAGVLMADAAEAEGIAVPPMPDTAVQRLLERNPFSAPYNPVDITAHALNDFSLIEENLTAMRDDGAYDLLVAFFTSLTASEVLGPRIQKTMSEALRGRGLPVALVGQAPEHLLVAYEADGIMVFEDPSRAVAALAALSRFQTAFDAPATDPADIPTLPNPPLAARSYGEVEAKFVVEMAGIAILEEVLVTTPQEAGDVAARLDCPVAMKIVSPDIAHKSEVGGVALNLSGADATRAAAQTMLATVAKHAPDADITGLLISPMASDGVELIVGAKRDEVFGMMIVVGLGGVFTEIMQDVALSLAPVTPARAEMMLRSLRGAPLMLGARGRAVLDIRAAANAVSRLSVLAKQNEATVESIEINPLLVRENGVVALDALILPRTL
ncbi:acetate--CoA ligase family protein [Profundibacter sp.]